MAPFLPEFPAPVPLTPMPAEALKSLRQPPRASQATLCPSLFPHAQKIAGTIGFIVNSVLPDGYFAYCALASYCNEAVFTSMHFAC